MSKNTAVEPERTGYRDLRYSQWHRTLSPSLSLVDIDNAEICEWCNEPVALIEAAFDDGRHYKKAFATIKLARAARIPAFIAFWTPAEICEPPKWNMDRLRVQQAEPHADGDLLLLPQEYESLLLASRYPHQYTCQRNEDHRPLLANLLTAKPSNWSAGTHQAGLRTVSSLVTREWEEAKETLRFDGFHDTVLGWVDLMYQYFEFGGHGCALGEHGCSSYRWPVPHCAYCAGTSGNYPPRSKPNAITASDLRSIEATLSDRWLTHVHNKHPEQP